MLKGREIRIKKIEVSGLVGFFCVFLCKCLMSVLMIAVVVFKAYERRCVIWLFKNETFGLFGFLYIGNIV